jgi:hypothetical protein
VRLLTRRPHVKRERSLAPLLSPLLVHRYDRDSSHAAVLDDYRNQVLLMQSRPPDTDALITVSTACICGRSE